MKSKLFNKVARAYFLTYRHKKFLLSVNEYIDSYIRYFSFSTIKKPAGRRV